jgi:hypothetical protein
MFREQTVFLILNLQYEKEKREKRAIKGEKEVEKFKKHNKQNHWGGGKKNSS